MLFIRLRILYQKNWLLIISRTIKLVLLLCLIPFITEW